MVHSFFFKNAVSFAVKFSKKESQGREKKAKNKKKAVKQKKPYR